MKTDYKTEGTGQTIFDVNRQAPQFAIACAIQELERHLVRYNSIRALDNASALLDEIECLRRFVLVRASLARGLLKTTRRDNRTVGRQPCDALHEMIGDVPRFVATYSGPGAPVMERDSFRAIACLNFLGSLDPNFL